MSDYSQLRHPSNAISFLSDNLKDGTLVLFLGAGASAGFGLPCWGALINSMRKELLLNEVANTCNSEELQHAADEILLKLGGSEKKLIELICRHLYDDIDAPNFSRIFENRLLISISALLMGSKRGHVTRVVTLNYDNLLEWFLSIFGFVVKSIYELPALEGTEDVRIYHPHGFIPHPKIDSAKSDFVILGMRSANKRLATSGDPWFELVRHTLRTGVCLFIGMSANSLSDRALAPLFTTTSDEISNRPLGIWLLTKEIDSPKQAEFQSNKIVPLVFKSKEGIQEFLLKICQESVYKPS